VYGVGALSGDRSTGSADSRGASGTSRSAHQANCSSSRSLPSTTLAAQDPWGEARTAHPRLESWLGCPDRAYRTHCGHLWAPCRPRRPPPVRVDPVARPWLASSTQPGSDRQAQPNRSRRRRYHYEPTQRIHRDSPNRIGRMVTATGKVHGEHGSDQVWRQTIPAPAVQSTTVDKDYRSQVMTPWGLVNRTTVTVSISLLLSMPVRIGRLWYRGHRGRTKAAEKWERNPWAELACTTRIGGRGHGRRSSSS
jgi:hypothetical protein